MPKKRIFVSCGQETEQEKRRGQEILGIIDNHGMQGFFAQEVHSADDLNAAVFKAVHRCDGFFAVMHKRGEVRYLNYGMTHRASVWIQQEIAILCYRRFLQARPVPVRVYMEEGIRLEGVMRTAIVNPISFKSNQEVLDGLSEWLRGPEFEEHPIVARREVLFQRRIQVLNPNEWLLLELIAAHSASPGDLTDDSAIRNDFFAVYRPQRETNQQIDAWYRESRARLVANDLVKQVDDHPAVGKIGLGIAKQWWDLILEELRVRGRLV